MVKTPSFHCRGPGSEMFHMCVVWPKMSIKNLVNETDILFFCLFVFLKKESSG